MNYSFLSVKHVYQKHACKSVSQLITCKNVCQVNNELILFYRQHNYNNNNRGRNEITTWQQSAIRQSSLFNFPHPQPILNLSLYLFLSPLQITNRRRKLCVQGHINRGRSIVLAIGSHESCSFRPSPVYVLRNTLSINISLWNQLLLYINMRLLSELINLKFWSLLDIRHASNKIIITGKTISDFPLS